MVVVLRALVVEGPRADVAFLEALVLLTVAVDLTAGVVVALVAVRVPPAEGDLRLLMARFFKDLPSKVTCFVVLTADTGAGSPAGRGGGGVNCLVSPLALVGVAIIEEEADWVVAGGGTAAAVTDDVVVVVWTGCPSGPGGSGVAGVAAAGVDGRLSGTTLVVVVVV